MNYVGWKINRFLVRILWKPLQVWGIKDPTSPAKNYVELIKVERRIKKPLLVTPIDLVSLVRQKTHYTILMMAVVCILEA